MSSPTDNFSDEVSNMELLDRAKNEFNREKRIIIKHISTDTTDKDILAFMGSNGEFPVEDVQMVKISNQAVVTLKDPSLVDDAICKLDNTELASHIVSVSKYHSTKMLCIANLPPDITEYKFRELVLEYGSVDRCFLMRSEETGESKGYGFVEYNEPIERVGQIKCLLDWMEIDEHIVHCDAIVDSANARFTFSDLHSKCLLIDNLPSDYNDSIALRELFSELVKPLYCQIVTKEGESLGFGIIEYENAADAESTYRKFNKHPINGIEMNISYCIPGKSAVHMFNRIMFKYGDQVHVNRASLLPEPVYPNPAFLRHPFFKIHFSKHPRLLVQFTDDLLHLQAGYVKSLEHKTNAKPGILGPAPSIPMSPLMDVNLQLGLLSLIVLDMKEKKTYIGEIPAPLGKLKLPADDEFQQKPEPVSLLGDPLTAQANMTLKNLLMPLDKIEGKQDAKTEVVDENDARLLGKPIHELSLIHLCSLGRIMAMMSEKNQMMGILGCAPTGPPKPLMEGLMQVGKVAQSLLTSMGIGPQNQVNPMNISQLELSKQQGLLGNPPNFNQMSQGSSNFMNSVKAMAFRNMSENEGSNSQLMSMFNNSRGNSSSGDGLLGSYQGQGSSLQNRGQSLQGKPLQPLLSLNLNKGDGLMPTPQLEEEEDGSYGFYGNQGYNDSEYQGGFGGKNFGNNSSQMMRTGSWRSQGGNRGVDVGQEMDTLGNTDRFEGAYFSGMNARQRTGKGQLEKKDGQYNNISQPAATYAGGIAAAGYQQQYDEYISSSGYPNNEYQDGNFKDNSYQVAVDNGLNVGGCSSSQGILGAYNDRSNLAYSSYELSSSVNTNANASMRPAGDYSNNMTRSNQAFGGQVKKEGLNTGRSFGLEMLPPTATGSILGACPSNINSTPQGQKRSYMHVLPSPEPSPEGDYIGQHSQGIGGHYADTYAKRQKLSGQF